MPRQKQEYSPKCQVKPNSKTETSTLSQRLNETAKMESANLPPKTNAKTHSKKNTETHSQTLDHRDQHAKINAKINAKADQPLHHKKHHLFEIESRRVAEKSILSGGPQQCRRGAKDNNEHESEWRT